MVAQVSKLVNIVVLYEPDRAILNFWCDFINKGELLIGVLNTTASTDLPSIDLLKFTKLILNQENLGLAIALNQGLAAAKDIGASHVMLLDQDSQPPVGMGHNLAVRLETLKNTGKPYAAISPTLMDRKAGAELHFSSYVDASMNNSIIDRPSIATSGTVIDMAALEMIGNMRDDLFIDGIDHEWCFRARSKGFRIGASPRVTMPHDMGDDGIVISGRYRPLHRSPVRHYYIVRNTLWLAQLAYIPRKWRAKEVAKLLYRIPVYFLNSSDRAATFKSLFRALQNWRLREEGETR
jgi:rhamnosyltransferase